MGKLEKSELEKLQKINIEMATVFVEFCKKHDV